MNIQNHCWRLRSKTNTVNDINFLMHVCVLSCFSCVRLWNPIDCSLPGFSVHVISQARILEWVAMLSSKESSRPRDQTYISWVSCIAGGFFTVCNTGDLDLIPGSGRSAEEGIGYPLQYSWASLMAQLVTNLTAMWEARVQSLGWEDTLEKGKATHSSILNWRTPWTV